MASALLAIGLATINTRGAIGAHGIGVIVCGINRTRRQVLIHDGFHECGGAHRAHFKKTNLFARQTHLRNGIVDHNAELGMETNLKRVNTHIYQRERAVSAREDAPDNVKATGSGGNIAVIRV